MVGWKNAGYVPKNVRVRGNALARWITLKTGLTGLTGKGKDALGHSGVVWRLVSQRDRSKVFTALAAEPRKGDPIMLYVHSNPAGHLGESPVTLRLDDLLPMYQLWAEAQGERLISDK